MIALRLIEEARAAGCSIEVEDGDLVVEADRDPPAELIASLRQHKAELIAALLRVCCECGEVITERLVTSWGGRSCHRACGEAAWRRALSEHTRLSVEEPAG
jgi:hypothetical protein